jgi:hypothetical protein
LNFKVADRSVCGPLKLSEAKSSKKKIVALETSKDGFYGEGVS